MIILLLKGVFGVIIINQEGAFSFCVDNEENIVWHNNFIYGIFVALETGNRLFVKNSLGAQMNKLNAQQASMSAQLTESLNEIAKRTHAEKRWLEQHNLLSIKWVGWTK